MIMYHAKKFFFFFFFWRDQDNEAPPRMGMYESIKSLRDSGFDRSLEFFEG